MHMALPSLALMKGLTILTLNLQIQSLQSKTGNSLLHQEEYDIVDETYKDDFNTFSLGAQVTLLAKFTKWLDLLSISYLINTFRVLSAFSNQILGKF